MRAQWITRVVEAEGMDEAFELARQGQGVDFPDEPIDDVVEVLDAKL
jgi:hypothetical protein